MSVGTPPRLVYEADMRPLRLLLAMGMSVFVPATAHAGRTEVVGSLGIIAPRPSPYRDNVERLGYDRKDYRNAFVVEFGALRSLNYWLSVGPFLRFDYSTLDAPYDAIPSIRSYAVSIAARVEADLFPWPRLFVWADPSYGHGWIGVPDAVVARGLWGVRGGIGIGMARDKQSLRFRIGYAYAPTTRPVSDWLGDFDYGGWLFQLDGVFRVAP
jgi:hypothetical protein